MPRYATVIYHAILPFLLLVPCQCLPLSGRSFHAPPRAVSVTASAVLDRHLSRGVWIGWKSTDAGYPLVVISYLEKISNGQWRST